MAVTVNINGLSCIHQTSGGMATATLPDVCRTPHAGTPIPYPNVAVSTDLAGGTVTVAVDGSSAAIQSSMFAKSSGDEAGALGGAVSQVFMMEATFLSFSPTVFFEGEPVCRLTDKMLMNKGNTVCMDGAVNQPVCAVETTPVNVVTNLDPGEPTFCKLQLLQIGCKHDRPPVDLIGTPTQLVQVMSTKDNPEEVSVIADGTCGYGHPRCPAVMVAREGGDWGPLSPSGTLEIAPPKKLGLSSISALIEWVTGAGEFPRERYLVRPLICNGREDTNVAVGVWAAVEVFHQAEITGKVSLIYAHPNITKPKEPAADGKIPYDRSATWTLTGALEGQVGGWKLPALKSSADMTGSDPLPVFGRLIDLVGKANIVFDSMKRFGTRVQGDLIPSEWIFSSAGLSLAELPSSHLVGPKGTFGFEAKPLIGARLTVSLLDYLILFAGSLCPGAGTGLAKGLLFIKDKLKSKDGIERWDGAASELGEQRKAADKVEFFSVDIDIELSAKGQLFGGFDIEFIERQGNLSGKVGGKLEVQVEARMLGRIGTRLGRSWRAEFAGGGKVGLGGAKGAAEPCFFEAKLTAAGKTGFVPVGTVEFSGLAAYYLLYAEAGIVGVESEAKGHADDSEDVKPRARESQHKKKPKMREFYKQEGIAVLMQPWTWTYTRRSDVSDPEPPPMDASQGAHGTSGVLVSGDAGGGGAGGASGV